MLLQNKYSRWYHGIVNAARQRQVIGYVERHHVLPRCMGGTDRAENRVALTPREHFICHALLVRMTEGGVRHKMLNALMKMKSISPDNKARYVNSRLFDFARREFAAGLRDSVLDADRRKKISIAKTGVKRPPMSDAQRRLIGLKSTGRLHTESYKVHMSASKSMYWAKKKAAGEVYPTRECPHCKVNGRGPNMSRYHFDNCKKAST